MQEQTKKKADRQELDGYLILNKSAGMTSQTAVNRIRRLFGAKKAGHTGTLDPMATGVLPILFGRATKLSDFLVEGQKHYEAELLLGITTDTEDISGSILTRTDKLPTEEAVQEAVAAFVGEIEQIPPMYSALKQNGKKLCDLARRGITVSRPPRRITVYSCTASRLAPDRYLIDVICSKGTYIRTLCADIGARLGTGGVMASLRRVETAGFSLKDAVTEEWLASLPEEERRACLRPHTELVKQYKTLPLPPFFARLAKSGCEIYLRKISADLPVGSLVTLTDNGVPFALGEVRCFPVLNEETGDLLGEEPAVKPIRRL